MSVINRVLRDLDQRAARAPLALQEIAAPAAPAPAPGTASWIATPAVAARPTLDAPSRWRLLVIVLPGAALIAAVAMADLSRLLPQAPPPMPAVMGAAPPASVAPAATAPAAADTAAPMVAALAVPAPAATPAPPRRTAAAARTAPAPTSAAAPAALLAAIAPAPLPSHIDKRSRPLSAEQQAAVIFREASDLARAGQRQAALQRALQAVTIEPRHAAARQLAAVLQHESGASDSALALLRAGAELEGAPPALALLLARLLSAQGQPDEALAVLDHHHLHSGQAEGLRAGLLAQRGQYGPALVAYESAVRQQPGNPMWWFGLAVALESEGQGARASAAYAQARQLGLPSEDLASYAQQRLLALD